MSFIQQNDCTEEFAKIHDRMDGLEKLLLALLNNMVNRCHNCNYAKLDDKYHYDSNAATRCKYWNECHNSICKRCAACAIHENWSRFDCKECISVRNLCKLHRSKD